MKLIFYLLFLLVTTNAIAQKVFNQPNAKGEWQYIYPFKDKNYVLAIQYNLDTGENTTSENNTFIYFGKKGTYSDQIFWKEHVFMNVIKENVQFEDYNNDGVKDLALFSTTGGRGSNEYYKLYLVNPKNHTLKKVIGFDEITNPGYDKKHRVIVGYGYAGSNYYSLYRINSKNKVYEIGEGFEDNEKLDLDKKIAEILKKFTKK
ncbi:hypothetical protein EZJ43_13265 [Pedobacter changchengzhani]|uniref:VCBS repeat-containing protein n=1 Tax=Pedobacter changchengzhani TaxID=2529274 RepID=A0A4R5MK58_9SPHI|nr:hypothetical protein [Pedobacter changchengzhani]TDG35585.1 hypothetical protein EZJ43_13265 [Pedobacter changchengzhani]